jgi:ABC-type Na+ efflux pump permease subunit
MKILSKLKSSIIFVKVIAQRAGSYIALVNLAMIVFLTLSNLKEKGYINIDIGVWVFPLTVLLILVFGILVYFEMFIWKGFHKEQEMQYSITPVHPDVDDMHKKLNEMYDEFKKNRKIFKE